MSRDRRTSWQWKKWQVDKERQQTILRNSNKIIVETVDKFMRWQERLTTFHTTHSNTNKLKTLGITTKEVCNKGTENGKSINPDKINIIIVKVIAEKCLDFITSLYGKIYNSSKIPLDWSKSTFVTLPKKHNCKQCNNDEVWCPMPLNSSSESSTHNFKGNTNIGAITLSLNFEMDWERE